MKKSLFSLIIIVSIFTINTNVYGLNKTSSNINEELIPINDNGVLVGVKDIITIPNDYDLEQIIIVPTVFNFINNYKKLIPGEEINIDLEIINNSKNNYSYINNSFIISTDDLSRYGISNNLNKIGTGFDNKNIYENFKIYRTYNEAIKYLYNEDEYNNSYLSSDNLDIRLKHNGYKGINDLNKFYIDYFNNKYNLNETDLNNFTYSVIKTIFSGEVSTNKETNTKVNELAYNYYYNKLLYYRFNNDKVDQFNSHLYSIGNYMNKNIGNNYFKDLVIFSDSSKVINNMNIGLNKYYYSDIFNEYGLYTYMELKLEKNNSYILPPDTGI